MTFFDHFVETKARSVFVVGAGLSHGLVPLPKELLAKLISSRASIESRLGCTTKINLKGSDAKELYQWAQEAVAELEAKGIAKPKLRLAEALTVTTNPAWQGMVGVPLRGSAPRHRVAARFAKEGKWSAIWSLNWDCILENALECVGLPPRPMSAGPAKLPWPEWHIAWTDPEAYPVISDDSTIVVVKPHGCVRKLLAGMTTTFLITEEELSNIELNQVKAHLGKHFTAQALFACGWSASEKYILLLLQELKSQNALGTKSPDSTLQIVDPEMSDGLKEVVTLYGADPAASWTRVAKPKLPQTDDVFLWLQARYGIHQMLQLWPPEEKAFQELLSTIATPTNQHWLYQFLDTFVPAWSLHCFKLGFTYFHSKGTLVTEHAIPSDRADEHVPFSAQHAPRQDLISAARLMLHFAKRTHPLDFESLPGAMWRESDRTALIPMPCWNTIQMPRWLAYADLMKRHRWLAGHRIERVVILEMHADAIVKPSIAALAACKRTIANSAGSLAWADESLIDVVDLTAI